MGDLNASIGEGQVIDVNELQNLPFKHLRCSKGKTVNWQVKRLLETIENIGGIVVNGRSMGDLQGDYSFCGAMGNSVIYFICSFHLLQYVDSFSVESKHMPLYLKIRIPIVSSSNTSQHNKQQKPSASLCLQLCISAAVSSCPEISPPNTNKKRKISKASQSKGLFYIPSPPTSSALAWLPLCAIVCLPA